jgi:hypothetical protein
MYKATRDFIRDRQPFARYGVKQVSVQQLGGGEDGNGYMNAHRRIDRSATSRSSAAGWCGPTTRRSTRPRSCSTGGTWTPPPKPTSTSPRHRARLRVRARHGPRRVRHPPFREPADNICHSVLLSDGRYTMVDRIFGELFYKPIESLETAALFKKVT